MNIIRCEWAKGEKYVEYHDKEWGVPSHDDDYLFEMLLLEGFQAGLSWITILNKRENFRKAFDGFDYKKIAKYGDDKFEDLLKDAGIIRNRLKITYSRANAIAYLEVRKEFGSFSNYIWGFVDDKPIVNNWKKLEDIPVKTELSDKVSQDLLKRGFKFVGSTIIYSFLQAVGILDDHVMNCCCKNKG